MSCQNCNQRIFNEIGSGGLVCNSSAVVTDNQVRGGVSCGGAASVDVLTDVYDGYIFVYPLDGDYSPDSSVLDLSVNELHGLGGSESPTQDDGLFCLSSQKFEDRTYITLPADNLSVDKFTLSMWVKINGYYLERQFYSRGNFSITLGHSVANHLWARLNLNTDEYEELNLYSNVLLAQDKWYLATITYDGLNFEMFINGTSVGSTVGSGSLDVPEFSHFGKLGTAAGLESNIQEARLTSYVRNQDYITAMYDNWCQSGFYIVGDTEDIS